MTFIYEALFGKLLASNWRLERQSQSQPIPDSIKDYYDWVPLGIWEFMESIELLATADDKSWFITSNDMYEDSESAFRWNQWERDSIDAAGVDNEWIVSIQQFWSNHLPIGMCVRDSYKYVALRREDLAIVGGVEPEFEETEYVAGSLIELLESLSDGKTCKYL